MPLAHAPLPVQMKWKHRPVFKALGSLGAGGVAMTEYLPLRGARGWGAPVCTHHTCTIEGSWQQFSGKMFWNRQCGTWALKKCKLARQRMQKMEKENPRPRPRRGKERRYRSSVLGEPAGSSAWQWNHLGRALASSLAECWGILGQNCPKSDLGVTP